MADGLDDFSQKSISLTSNRRIGPAKNKDYVMTKHEYPNAPPNITTMPPGVPFIIGNEVAERFSFYGVRSIVIIYCTEFLGMLQADAHGLFALFVAVIYFCPIFGSILAEGLLGKYRTILYLSIVYCLGHLTLTFLNTQWAAQIGTKWVLYTGLLLIGIGSGGIKPCVSANVGDQFGESNRHFLAKVFGWFYFSINTGAFFAAIFCPILLNNPHYGPCWAFGIPGVAMVIATIFFWAGRKKFVHVPPAGLGFIKQMFSREGLSALLRLAVVYVFVAVFWSLWDQSSGGSWTLQARSMNLHWLGMNLLPAQVHVANPILIFVFVPLLNYIIYPAIDRVFFLTPLRKIGIGLFLTASSYVVIWYTQTMIDAGLKPNLSWQFLAYAILTLGEVMVSITGLEFSYTQAPNKMKSAVMALWLFTVSLGNLFTAMVNKVIRNPDGSVKMDDQHYYLFFAGLMFVAAAVFVPVARFYRGRTYLQSQEDY